MADGERTGGRLAFRVHVETRGPGEWRRLAEPAWSHERWTRCAVCGGRIRRLTARSEHGWPVLTGSYAHLGESPCDGAAPTVATVRLPWYGPRIGRELAAILAGDPAGTTVRFPAISPARDVPRDASDEVRRAAAEDGAGFGHSHLTVRELLAYDWQQTITRSAVVAEARAAYAMHAAATNHALPAGIRGDATGDDAVRITWPWPAWAAAGPEWMSTVVRLGGVAAGDVNGDTNDVRCVFWFGAGDDGH